jgi:hypothetical protein
MPIRRWSGFEAALAGTVETARGSGPILRLKRAQKPVNPGKNPGSQGLFGAIEFMETASDFGYNFMIPCVLPDSA